MVLKTNKQTNKHSHKQTNKQTSKQTNKQTNKQNKQNKTKQKKKQTNKQTKKPSIFNFPPFLLQVSFFSSQFSTLFPFFLASFFPLGRQKFPGQKSLRGSIPLPPACYVTAWHVFVCLFCFVFNQISVCVRHYRWPLFTKSKYYFDDMSLGLSNATCSVILPT